LPINKQKVAIFSQIKGDFCPIAEILLIFSRKNMSFLVFYVTHASLEQAQALGSQLLSERLIACANYFPITSAYHWQGQVENEAEYVSLFKTANRLETKLENRIQALHPYATPCIIRWEARANTDYEAWIQTETEATQLNL
jgi:periplasmic divalent cation tolerance protein